jgi:hypothetical protein
MRGRDAAKVGLLHGEYPRTLLGRASLTNAARERQRAICGKRPEQWRRLRLGVSCALLAGGGLRSGQVIGSTTRLGESPKDRPVNFQEVHATIYRHLGIDVQVPIPDLAGRPQYLLENHRPIAELV